MSKIIGWDEIDPGQKNKRGGGGDSKYLKLTGSLQGTSYRVRPVGDPCKFYAYYMSSPEDPKRFNRAITEDPNNCIIAQKYNQEAKLRYATNVIDRADGKLKIMEAPASVFDAIKIWAKAAGQEPGGKGGADFEITVKLPPDGNRKRTEYKTTPIVQTPWTDADKEAVNAVNDGKLWDLEKEFAPTPQNEIEAKLYGPKPAAAGAPTAKAPAKASNSASDLGF